MRSQATFSTHKNISSWNFWSSSHILLSFLREKKQLFYLIFVEFTKPLQKILLFLCQRSTFNISEAWRHIYDFVSMLFVLLSFAIDKNKSPLKKKNITRLLPLHLPTDYYRYFILLLIAVNIFVEVVWRIFCRPTFISY